MDKRIKKGDIILIVVVLFITATVGALIYMNASTGSTIIITIEGQEYARYPLNVDLKEQILTKDGNYNLLVIEDGYASIIEADCPNQSCVHQRKIHISGESIICLPHQLTITVDSNDSSGIDAVSQ